MGGMAAVRTYHGGHGENGQASPPGGPARLLRGRGTGGRHRREALERFGAPIYVRKEIVHNRHVVETLQERGVIFVEENDEVPEGATVVFSAHGVAPVVHEQAAERDLMAIDATCPLVTKVHNEAKRFAREGYRILLDRA